MRESESTNPTVNEEEISFEQTIRPKVFSDFTGQKKITDVAPGYWFSVLIDEDDTPFDCWVRQL